MKPIVAIDASNLHIGGGIQVAASVATACSELDQESLPFQLHIYLSTQVAANCSAEVLTKLNPTISDSSWRQSGDPQRFQATLRFLIFGPEYQIQNLTKHQLLISGFADGTSVFDWETKSHSLKTKLRRKISQVFFQRLADKIVVEAAPVKNALSTRWRIPENKIAIVPNVINPALTQSATTSWQQLGANYLEILYVARAYPHKNHAVLKAAGEILRDAGINCRFTVTVTPAELAEVIGADQSLFNPIGPKSTSQLSDLYDQTQLCIFPSLIESFSVTPLEALARRRPLLASDRGFVKDIVQEAGWYFEPTDPNSVAETIKAVLDNSAKTNTKIEIGTKLIQSWPTYQDRLQQYLLIIEKVLTSKGLL